MLYKKYTLGQDVEHIIDTANSEPDLEKCDKNIRGNLILANHIWNTQIGQLCWKHVKDEKSTVYGEIFLKAMHNVRQCCSKSQPNSPTTDDTDIQVAIVLGYLFMSGIIFLVVVGGIVNIIACISQILRSWGALHEPIHSSDSDYDFDDNKKL